MSPRALPPDSQASPDAQSSENAPLAPENLCVLLGGSFDPVHGAHLALADAVRASCPAAALIWVPAARSPFKSEMPQASNQDRCAMLAAVLADRPAEVLDQRELEREPPSYSLETVRALQAERGSQTLALAMGADAFSGIANWFGAAELIDRVVFLVAPRPGDPLPQLQIPGYPQARVYALPMAPVDLSSTWLREELAAGRDPGPDSLPRAVMQIIQARGLYGWAD